jgi:hypothetical protein
MEFSGLLEKIRRRKRENAEKEGKKKKKNGIMDISLNFTLHILEKSFCQTFS